MTTFLVEASGAPPSREECRRHARRKLCCRATEGRNGGAPGARDVREAWRPRLTRDHATLVTVQRVAAAKFKATCLKLMDRVAETGEPVEITKRGKVIARLVPAEEEARPRKSVFGAAAHLISYAAPTEELFTTGEVWDGWAKGE